MYQDTVAAIATPLGSGALGVVRLSGPQSLALARRVFDGRLRDHHAEYGRLVDPAMGSPIDEVIAVYFKAPRSYTREDMVEFSCHGGAVPLQWALRLLLEQGARAAEPGEFTLRAFLNGRIDLAQAEAVLDVIHARSERGLQLGIHGLAGGLSDRVRACRAEVLGVLAYLTALVDFPADEVGEHDVAGPLAAALGTLDELLMAADQGAVFRQGLRIAIIGPPNAGKSSLLNRLLGWERALVSDIPGTTRDTLEETLVLRGVPFVLTDTAGITVTAHPVEQAGVERSWQQAAAADLVLLVVDGNRPSHSLPSGLAAALEDRTVVLAANKCDLELAMTPAALRCGAGLPPGPALAVSARTGAGLDALVDALVAAALGGGALPDDRLLTANPRQRAALAKAHGHVQAAVQALVAGQAADLMTIDLTAGVAALGEITGETASDELLDAVFSRFCIGK